MTRPTILRAVIAGAVAIAAVPAALHGAGGSAAKERSIDAPATATYDGGEIPTSEASTLGLSCNLVTESAVSCYDTPEEAAAALSVETMFDAGEGTTAAASVDAGGGIVPTASCYPAMTLYSGTSFTGATFNIAVQSVWVNLSGYGWSNITSSWTSGCAGGYLADGASGSGSTVGQPANRSMNLLGHPFDNKASSAKRCPC